MRKPASLPAGRVAGQEDGRRDGQRKQRLGRLLFFVIFVSFVVMVGCAGTPKQEVGITAPVTVATDEGDVDVEATTVTEAETMAAGAVKADTAGDIRTFGLDEGTRSLLGQAFAGFWKQTGVVTCVVVGAGLFLLCVKLDIPEHYRLPLMGIGLAMAAIPVLKWALLA